MADGVTGADAPHPPPPSVPSTRRSTNRAATKPSSSSSAGAAPATSRRKGGLTSLAPLLRHFIGLEVTIELKTGRLYRGTLKDADNYMNLVLDRVVRGDSRSGGGGGRSGLRVGGGGDGASTSSLAPSAPARPPAATAAVASSVGPPTDHRPGGSAHIKENLDREEYDLVHVRGPSIRYVHFPDNVDLPALIKAGIEREKAAADKYRRGKRKSR